MSLIGTVRTVPPSMTSPQSISGFDTRTQRPSIRTSVSRFVEE